MKGKSIFSKQEAQLIQSLIEEKLKAKSTDQKKIRNRIRSYGFYASDFGVGNGYTVEDFLSVITIDGQEPTTVIKKEIKRSIPNKITASKSVTSQNDEAYILELCDEVLHEKALRQHRFDFLRGDTGVRLPVDAYYKTLKLVVEYHERQHTEEVKFFDNRITSSGVGRGEQRKLYDERRKIEIPRNGLELVIFNYSEFAHSSAKRLLRNKTSDVAVIMQKLKNYIN